MKPYQRGDVVVIDVPMLANSHIQAGKRPWVVVQNNVGNQFSSTSIVVPLTTKIKRLELPTHVAVTWGSLQPSMVECEQVRVVDVSDDWEYICTLPPEIMRHVDTALKNAFFYGGGVEKKICPLSMSCPEDIPLCPCQKQRCAWWDEDSQDCAAVVLARAMKKRK